MRKRLFFIGIGGYGMSAIARLMNEMGYSVSGSDQKLSPLALDLRKAGINVYEGHHADHLVGIDMVIRSSAIPDDNPEVSAAHALGIAVLKRADFLGEVMQKYIGIAVAGTHGKTTTTAMIAWILSGMDQDPSYIIGGVSKNLGTNAHAGQGKYFVIEADEYDRMFLGLKPQIAVITNSEHDHPDCYPTPLDYQQAFLAFARKINPQGFLVICGDDEGNQAIIKQLSGINVITYGFGTHNNFQSRDLIINSSGCYHFSFVQKNSGTENLVVEVDLSIPGKHNVLNATAALAVAQRSDMDLNRCARLLHQFSGTGRRFDLYSETNGITLIDDYAHHPTEIITTLEAAKSRYPNRNLWVVWQPHTFSRSIALIDRFAKSFEQADHIIVTPIFASREKNSDFTSVDIVTRINHRDIRTFASHAEISHYLINHLQTGDVLLVLSAGDADEINPEVARGLLKKEGAQ